MPQPSESLLESAHDLCHSSKESVLASGTVGCFYCLAIFDASACKWHLETRGSLKGQTTAICPHCGIDSVIPKSDDYTLDEDFLRAMYARWFT